MKKCMILTAVLATAFAYETLAEAAAQAPAPEAAAEEAAAPAEAQKKRPKKDPKGYTNWDKAVEIAEAWEQPVFVFLELKGDKVSGRVKTQIFGNRDCKFIEEFVNPNAVYYHYAVDAKKRDNRGNNQKNRNAPPEPDMSKIKESERMIISRLTGGQHKPVFPIVALVTPAGKVLGTAVLDEQGPVFGGFVNGLKTAFESGSYPVELKAKVQKAIDREAKAFEKRNRK